MWKNIYKQCTIKNWTPFLLIWFCICCTKIIQSSSHLAKRSKQWNSCTFLTVEWGNNFTCATWIAWLELRSHILHCLSVDAVNTFVPSCNYCKQYCYGARHEFFTYSVLNTSSIKAETHDAKNCCDTSRRQLPSSALIWWQVAAITHLFGAHNRFWKRGNVN